MWRQSLSDHALHESVSHKVNSNGKHVVTPESWLMQNPLALQIKAKSTGDEEAFLYVFGLPSAEGT